MTSAAESKDGHVLSSLWAEYEKNNSADLPKKCLATLEKIKKEALSKKLPYDFYDASVAYVDVSTRRDWKLRDSLMTALKDELAAFGNPALVFHHMSSYIGSSSSELWEFVEANRKALASSHLDIFYKDAPYFYFYSPCEPILAENIENDYEYALWVTYARATHYWMEDNTAVYGALEKTVGSRYPLEAVLEYARLEKLKAGEEKTSALENLAKKYKGKAAGLIFEQDILSGKFSKLSSDNASSKEFKDLYEECLDFEKRRAAFKGDEKTVASVCEKVGGVMEELDSREIRVAVKEDEVSVMLRNLPSAKLSLLDAGGKEIKSFDVENKVRSFYAVDTVKFSLGALDDGNYSLKAVSGKVSTVTDYEKKTLSIAWCQGVRASRIYVAEYKTGKPLGKVKLELYKGDKVVLTHSSLALDGFTYLPSTFENYIKSNSKSYFELVCSDVDGGRLRKTKPISLNKYFFNAQNSARVATSGDYATLMLDCAAFHPGDEVRFKTVLYSGCSYKAFKVFPKGRTVEARLFNPDGELVAKKSLKTSSMGSAASSFRLEKLSHNGMYSICIFYGSRCLATKYFDVDDFVLPTFEIKFDVPSAPRIAGDDSSVTGSVKAYSGHNLSSARVTYSLIRSGAIAEESPLQLAPDGSFSIALEKELEAGYYRLVVKVVDATGETIEEAQSFSIARDFDLSVAVPGKADASFERLENDGSYYESAVVSSSDVRVVFDALAGGKTVPVKISYKATKEGKSVLTGEALPKDEETLSLPDEGLYEIVCSAVYKTATGRETKAEKKMEIVRINKDSQTLPFACENVFMMKEDASADEIAFRMGVGGETWAIAELFDVDSRFVASQKIHIDASGIATVSFPFSKEYSEAMAVSVFYFRNGRIYSWNREFHRPAPSINPALTFSRFEDKSLPGAEYTVTLQAWKGAEALVAVFDKASETICPNVWTSQGLYARSAWAPYVSNSCGSARSFEYRYTYGNGVKMLSKAAATMEIAADDMVMEEASMAYVQNDLAGSVEVEEADYEAAAGVAVREDFADVLAFEPFVEVGEDGTAEVKFRTSDKLSTYIVSAYAHDAEMNNNVVRKEMTVTMPVKASLVQPRVLYKGDRYVASAAVSSISGEKVSGRLMLFAYDRASYEGEAFVALKQDVTVGAGETVSAEFPIDVPTGDIEALGLKLVFVGDTFSDAIFVTSPVKPRSQVLTEAHSGILLAGMSEEELINRLRAEFTGTTHYGAEYYERNVYDMVLDAIPSRVDPSSDNVLSLSEALYVRKIASLLGSGAVSGTKVSDSELVSKILECRNADGGFAWFEEMPSSPIITAVLLERFHRMAGRGVLPAELEAVVDDAVKYLDKSYFKERQRPWWCGWLYLEQYLYVRSEYASVPFSEKLTREFKKESKAFLFPKKSRVTPSVYTKVRRASILARLMGEGGKELAKSWGLGSYIDRKLENSLEADILSLSEYAVDHRNGGLYYPNMVSPYGGLLESQLHTHVALLDLLDLTGELPEVADGVRLWMLLLKETQQWDAEPCYIDAIASILEGSESLKATKVIVLRKTYEKPLEEITPAGNGMKIERTFSLVAANGKKTALKDGDPLKVGDKVVAEYRVWSQEYRSFVRINAPRPGCLAPVDQTSGRYGWRFSPIRCFTGGALISVSPCGYRDSRFDRSEYWFDCFPEEKTTITEEFYVTQKGVFVLPAMEVESLYAPHYRANSAATILSTK
ncbi:MAG: hypothetical protein MJY56_05175 [Bacteroidales bacterium]|nr:hypothetical protein [Bacteroidales bacterium]